MKICSGDVYNHFKKPSPAKQKKNNTSRIRAILRDEGYMPTVEIAARLSLNVATVRRLINENMDLYKLYQNGKHIARARQYVPFIERVDRYRDEGLNVHQACAKAGSNKSTYYLRKERVRQWL